MIVALFGLIAMCSAYGEGAIADWGALHLRDDLGTGAGLAAAGFAATGLGVANMFPAAMTRAGLAAGPRGVAAASTLGYAGFLLGPPTIGLLANGIGLPAGLTTVSALALLAAVLAGLAHRFAGEARETRETGEGAP